MLGQDAGKAARLLLEQFWKPGRFPVDPVYLAKQLGINVVKADLPEEVSGALLKERGKDPVIYLHSSDSDVRKRFTCAHELGHYYLRLGEDTYESVDLRDKTLSAAGNNSDEVFANNFAASLLMPEDEVKKRASLSKLELVKFFGVSGEAMKWRLKNLGVKHEEFEVE